MRRRTALAATVFAGVLLGAHAPALAAADDRKPWAIEPWHVTGETRQGIASAWDQAKDGKTVITIDCNRRLGPNIGGALYFYAGAALARIDDQTDTMIFSIRDAAGNVRGFNGQVHYYAPDKAWVLHQYPVQLLDALAGGSTLTIRNRSGASVAEFDLSGAAQARAAMRRVCRL